MATKKTLTWLVGTAVTLLVAVVGGTWVYLNVVRDEPPPPLTVDAAGSASTPTTGATGRDGKWQVSSGSEAGYRVDEILFGQRGTAVGRTDDVAGSFTVAATTVTAGSFSVDLTSVASGESLRDRQFAGRIMAVDQFPTATFALTAPIDLSSLPTAQATGDLTLRGTTKPVTIPLTVTLDPSGASAKIAGALPVVFAEWGIPNPSAGPAETEDNGVLEFLLVVKRTS